MERVVRAAGLVDALERAAALAQQHAPRRPLVGQHRDIGALHVAPIHDGSREMLRERWPQQQLLTERDAEAAQTKQLREESEKKSVEIQRMQQLLKARDAEAVQTKQLHTESAEKGAESQRMQQLLKEEEDRLM